jgi:hypothetical protein
MIIKLGKLLEYQIFSQNESIPFEFGTAIAKLRRYKSPGSN